MVFKFELRFPDGDDAAVSRPGEANWQPGDTLIGHGNRRYRITAVIPIEREEEFIEKPLAGVL